MTIRAFIAAELDEPLRRDIARVQEQLRTDPGLRDARIAWVRPASLHLTLKFLGDIDDAAVPVLHESIAAAIGSIGPIDIPFTRLGAFPRLQEPRNLWLGPDDHWGNSDEARRLQRLVLAIEACCGPWGVEAENRPFSPHLTLGRVKAGERQIGRALTGLAAARHSLAPLTLGAVSLMKSQLDSKGAVHTRLRLVPLAPLS